MRNFKVVLTISLMGLIPFVHAETEVNKTERSLGVFSKGLETLLLDTPHVFVRADESIESVYLENVGALFMGRISITEGSNISIMINDWSNWFQSNEEEPPEPPSAPSQAEKEPGKEPSKDSSITKVKKLKEKDQERIRTMNDHLSSFKKELIVLIQDYGMVLKGLNSKEEIIIVLKVKDREFKAAFKTEHLVLRVRQSDLQDLSEKKPDDPDVQKLINFNLSL